MAKKGLLENGIYTYKKFGFKGFYKGAIAVMPFSLPLYSVRFGAYDFYKSHVFTDTTNLFLCGMMTGLTEAFLIVTPSETLRVQLIHDRISDNKLKNIFTLSKSIYDKEGFLGFYKGLGATMIKQGFNVGIRFFGYEESKRALAKADPTMSEFSKRILAGQITGIAAVTLSQPIDLVKSKMQGLDGSRYKNVKDCLVKIYKENGLKGYALGLKARYIKVIIIYNFSLPLYEYFYDLLEYMFPSNNNNIQFKQQQQNNQLAIQKI